MLTYIQQCLGTTLRDAFQIKKEKTFRHLSKFKHTPPSLPHFWQFSILTKNSGSYPLPPSVNLDESLFLVNVNSTHLRWQKQSNSQIYIKFSIIKSQYQDCLTFISQLSYECTSRRHKTNPLRILLLEIPFIDTLFPKK